MIIVARLARVPDGTVYAREALAEMDDLLVPIDSDQLELNGKALRIVKAWVEDGWVQAEIEVPDELRTLFGSPDGGYLGMSFR